MVLVHPLLLLCPNRKDSAIRFGSIEEELSGSNGPSLSLVHNNAMGIPAGNQRCFDYFDYLKSHPYKFRCLTVITYLASDLKESSQAVLLVLMWSLIVLALNSQNTTIFRRLNV